MVRRFASIFAALPLLVAACGRHKGQAADPAAPAAEGQPQGGTVAENVAPPAPAADTRDAGQIIVDTVAKGGTACALDTSSRWVCTTPGQAWPYLVTYQVNADTVTNTIYLSSYQDRAFGKKCAKFTDAASDLADPTNAFSVACDDGTQQFQLTTAFTLGAGAIDDATEQSIVSWITQHDSNRQHALTMLESIHAIRH